jgi:hypothetical protein
MGALRRGRRPYPVDSLPVGAAMPRARGARAGKTCARRESANVVNDRGYNTTGRGDRQDHQRALEHARQAHIRIDEFIDATNKATIENANLVFRTTVLINGAAAVSILAFVGGLMARRRSGTLGR